MIRPQPTEWFEILVAREDLALALEALARKGCVELEAIAGEQREASAAGLQSLLQRYESVARRYSGFWPSSDPAGQPGKPHGEVAAAVAEIEAWACDAAAVVEALRAREAERASLAVWREALAQIASSALDLRALADPRSSVKGALFVFPGGSVAAPPPALLGLTMTIGAEPALLAIGQPEVLAAFTQHAGGVRANRYDLPEWLRSGARDSLELVTARLEQAQDALAAARAQLESLSRAHRLGQAIGRVRHAEWLLRSLPLVRCGENFCRITGWTDDGARLCAALDASGARAVAHFPQRPPGIDAPLLLRNPWWVRPFEIFIRAFGMPARNAADPSALLAVIVPLLFGYMFGDIGQGVVLVVAGLLLRRRVPALGILVAGGASAMLFGLLFGSVFGLHGIVPALWTAPLESPLPVLMVPLAAGAVLLLLGLFIGALEAYWRGKFRHWLAGDAGVVLAYAGILAAFLHESGYWIAALGAALPLVGHLAITRRLRPALAALGKLVESTLQLLVNTISFVRVGAFALAHAGLSSAIVALADAADGAPAKAAVLVLGNAAAIVVEAMVVGVQTTRLVLFEFFTRFFVGKGREFHPLPPPAFISGGLRETTS